jgi:WD40 repeat protein
MRFLLAILALAGASTGFAQEKKAETLAVVELKRTDPVSYDKDIEPLFYKKCTVCHSGKELKGKLDLSSYETLMKGGQRGQSVIPAKGNESLIYKLVHREMKPFMPPKGEDPVTPEELALIKLWIDQGAKAPTSVRAKVKIIVGVPPANVVPVRAVAVAADDKSPMVATGRGNQIHIYDAVSGNHLRTLVAPGLKAPDGKEVKAAHLSIIEALAFSPDGKTLVSGSFQEVGVWNPETGELVHKIPGFAHNVVALAFSADGAMLATAGGEPTVDGEIKVFNTEAWQPIMDLKAGHSDTAYGLCFNPDGKMLATASADKFVKVWEVPSAKFVKSFEGHTHHVLDIGWSADGKLLASAGGDNTVKIWDFEKGEQARTVQAHGKQVTRLLFVGKKTEFLTAGGDNQVKMFNATNGGATKTFPGALDFVYAIGVNPSGTIVAAGGQDGAVRVYNGTSGAILKTLVPPGVQFDASAKAPEQPAPKKGKKKA